jgi:hypothetical protein
VVWFGLVRREIVSVRSHVVVKSHLSVLLVCN